MARLETLQYPRPSFGGCIHGLLSECGKMSPVPRWTFIVPSHSISEPGTLKKQTQGPCRPVIGGNPGTRLPVSSVVIPCIEMPRPSDNSSLPEPSPSVENTGVRSKVTIPAQSTAGPYPADIQLGMNATDSRLLMFYLHVKARQGKIVSEKSDVSLSWMLYVKPARDRHEQNLEAFRDVNGRIFFRSLRAVESEEELLVWYSDLFAREIGIPPLTPNNIQGNQLYVCHKCDRKYEYPNPLKAHMRFRCVVSRAEILSNLLDSPPLNSPVGNHWLSLPGAENGVARQLFPSQTSPSDLSPKRVPQSSDAVVSSSSSAINELNIAEEIRSKTVSPTPRVLPQPRTSVVPDTKSTETVSITTATAETSSQAAKTLSTSQPIQIFNHIHPPAIPIPLDHHAFKLYYPFYAMPQTQSVCCGRMPSVPFDRGVHPYPYKTRDEPHPHHHHHLLPTDLSLKPSPRERVAPAPEARCSLPMTSSVCPTPGGFPYPLPSENAGEPLDLLPRHLYLSKSRKGHLCIYCGKLYSRKYGLKIHLRTHTGYKPLKCKVCLRPFGDPSNLNKHVRLHAEGDTPYRCEFCGKVLVRRRDLVRHIKSRHPNEVQRADEIENSRDSKTHLSVKKEAIETVG